MCKGSSTGFIGDDAAAFLVPEVKVEAKPDSTTAMSPPGPRRDLDMAMQKAMVREERAQRHREWVEAQSPKVLSDDDRQHCLRSLVVASAVFHKERHSSKLHRTVRRIVAGSKPDMLQGIPVATHGLARPLVQVLFTDLGTLSRIKGVDHAKASLMELPLWDSVEGPRQAPAARRPTQ